MVRDSELYLWYKGDELECFWEPILIGMPFLKTAQAMINVHDRVLTMEFDGKMVKLNLFEPMKHPSGQDGELEPTNNMWLGRDVISLAEDNKLSAGWETTHYRF